MSSNYLTTEELIYAIEHEGHKIQERTIRFWISKGVLEKPLRKPFKHADGRARYFHRRVVGEILQILTLRDEGWKLTQIKNRLRSSTKVTQKSMPTAEGMAKLLLSDLLGNGEFRDRVRAVEMADPDTPEWRKLRNFLVARLSHFVGRKQAVRAVTSFLVGLSPREMTRLQQRVGVGTDQEPLSPARSQLLAALDVLEEPEWTENETEPLLSRRLRRLVAEIRTVEDDKTLESLLKKLRHLRGELTEALAFLGD